MNMMIINLQEITACNFSQTVSDKLNRAMEFHNEVILDLAGIKEIEFEGLKTIISCGKKYRGKGRHLKMRNVPESIRGQLMMVGVNSRNEEVVLS